MKQNQGQLMNSSDLSGPPALRSAKMTLEDARCLVVWPGDIFHTISCGPALSPFRWQEGRAGRCLAAGEHTQMSFRCHCALLWIPAWSPHTLGFSFQDRKTVTKWPLHLAFWSEMRSLEVHGFIWGRW